MFEGHDPYLVALSVVIAILSLVLRVEESSDRLADKLGR
jgi:hypothetical protein